MRNVNSYDRCRPLSFFGPSGRVLLETTALRKSFSSADFLENIVYDSPYFNSFFAPSGQYYVCTMIVNAKAVKPETPSNS